jgi:hypothetical protein
MQISTRSPREAPPNEVPPPVCRPPCPVCSGALVPLHNLYRCSRCFYTLCAGCEPVEARPAPED